MSESPPSPGPKLAECAVCGRGFALSTKPGRPAKTCSPTCQRKRKNHKSQQSRIRAFNRDCPPDKHGTATGYTFYGCGCPPCTRWAREDRQARRVSQAGHPR